MLRPAGFVVPCQPSAGPKLPARSSMTDIASWLSAQPIASGFSPAIATTGLVGSLPARGRGRLPIAIPAHARRCVAWTFKSGWKVGLCYGRPVRHEAVGQGLHPLAVSLDVNDNGETADHVIDETHTYGREATRRAGDHPANPR